MMALKSKALNNIVSLLVVSLISSCLFIVGCSQDVDSLAKKLNHKDPEVRRDAVVRLGQTRDPRALEPLILALQDEDSSVKIEAMTCLGRLKDPRAIEPLVKALDVSKYRSNSFMFAGQALAEIGEPAIESVIAALKNGNPGLQMGAACAFRFLKNSRAVEALITALKDENPSVRRCAACALGSQKDPRAAEPLIRVLEEDKTDSVRTTAATALSKITGNNLGDNPEKWRNWWEENKVTFLRPMLPSKD